MSRKFFEQFIPAEHIRSEVLKSALDAVFEDRNDQVQSNRERQDMRPRKFQADNEIVIDFYSGDQASDIDCLNDCFKKEMEMPRVMSHSKVSVLLLYWRCEEKADIALQQEIDELHAVFRDQNPLLEPQHRQLYHHRKQGQRDYGFDPEKREPRGIKISDLVIGDEGIGPSFGRPEMSREDDDDDDCVGFRGFAVPTNCLTGLLDGKGDRRELATKTHMPEETLRGTIPKFGPPKRDPVAVTLRSLVRCCADRTTLHVWGDAIARTCGGATGRGPTEGRKWEKLSWKSGGVGIHGNAQGRGGLMCAY